MLKPTKEHGMLCCGRKKGRESTPDLATSPRRQLNPQAANNNNLRLGPPPPMVIQDDFRKVSGISNEIFRQIETVERDHDANTAAELEEVERTGGEMIVRTLNPRHLSKQALDHAKRFFSLQDARHIVKLVEIVKRPAQTLGLYIREGNGQDRSDGVFISRIASESSVSTSGCLQVNDEILAVNMVDVTRMSIDDVVIIMSIPRRLVLVIRQSKYPTSGSQYQQSSSQYRSLEHKAPVVVIKKDLSRDEDLGDEMDDEDRHSGGGPHGRYHPPMYSNMSMERDREREAERERHHRDLSAGRHNTDRNMPVSRSHLALGIMDSNGDLNGGVDLYYNSRPNQAATLDRDLRSGRNRDRRDQTFLGDTYLKKSTIGLWVAAFRLAEKELPQFFLQQFLKYKIESAKPGTDEAPPVSGLLWVHLLAGRGLRAHSGNSNGSTPSSGIPPTNLGTTRDLYCVLECDRIHKARTVVRTGDLVFDWDETFELDLVGNKELDFLIYSWDPQYRHKLCYKGSVHMATLLKESPIHQLALKIEPRGTLYLRLRHTDPYHTYLRRSKPLILPTRTKSLSGGLFGGELEAVVMRENITGGVPGGMATSMAVQSNVPIIVRRCVEEVERRGLDIIGLYRLCGSATKKRILREAFERNARTADLSPDAVPDINVITGVLRDYLRELPEPLFTKCLYQMMVDALTVCLQDDPEGNAKLMFSILDCLPKINRATLIYLMDHLALVVSQAARNKMTPQNLAVCFGPILMLHSESRDKELDFQEPINVLRYLLEIWPSKSVRELLMSPNTVQPIPPMRPPKGSPLPQPPPLPMKPASFSQTTGLVPTVSKGIRKPPPALPARCTPVVVASPTSENSSSEDEIEAMTPLTNRDSSRIMSSAHNMNGSNVSRIEEKWSSGPPRHPPPQLPARIRPGPPTFIPPRIQEPNNGHPNGATQQLKVNNASGGDGPSPQSSHSSMSSSSPRSLPRSPNERIETMGHSTIPLEPMNKTSENEEPMVETPSSSTGTEEDSRRELGEREVDDADEESSEDDLK
ncbi:rho GTPase-activating protein 100F [Diaphorina citri]|uniref:Rho GTPase-activating protein 100F n=1 Tax=Diaphorina citri TaxID=121845 RepID=A0A3Q0IVZ1_DIACI|nr:rho GTPase-activating protein 100F [Diaphorina citri]